MKQKLLYVLVLLAMLVSACGSSGEATATVSVNATEAPASSGGDATLRIGWLGKPDTLNPAYAFLSESYTIFHLIYSTLTTQAADGSYVGLLAKDWSVSDDGLTWTNVQAGVFLSGGFDNTGLGVLVRSGGPAREVVLTGNRIVGTRPGVVQNAQGQGSVGDGIAVLTGTDGIGSHAVLQGNTVYGNSRLGILLHGTGTTCEANGNVFLAGNGYSGELSSLVSGSPDFLYQQGATVTGSDLSWSQQPSEDIYANPGGGDPRLPSY